MATVSIIVPSYNHARFLRRRIDTILAQTYQDFELILLDDASTDGSQEILREYVSDPRARLDFNDVNSGTTFKQWNKGVGLAQGKYVWIAESDDYSDPRFLERVLKLIQSDPGITFAYSRSRQVLADDTLECFGDWYLVLWDPDRWKKDFCMDGRQMCERYFSRTNPVPNASAVVFRKDIYERVGGADEQLRVCGDWKLWAGMALQGKVAYLGQVLNYFRLHPNSVRNQSREARNDLVEHLLVTRWVLDRVSLSDAELHELCSQKTMFWVPMLASLKVPLGLKRSIFKHVRNVDPHPFRHALRPALTEIRLKIRRHWRELSGRTA